MAKQKRKVNVEMPGLEDFEIPPDAPPETADMMKLLQKAYADPEGLSEEEFNAFMGIANALSEAEDAAIAPEDREKAAALGAQAFELWQAGEVDEAFDKANDALDLNPSEPTADLVNAVLSIESDQEAFEAMAAISMQVEFELRRENDDRRTDLLEEVGNIARVHGGVAAFQAGHFESAVGSLAELLENGSDEEAGMAVLFLVAALIGDEEAESALSLIEQSDQPHPVLAWGRVLAKLSVGETAQPEFKEAMAEAPEVYEHLTKARLTKDQRNDALQQGDLAVFTAHLFQTVLDKRKGLLKKLKKLAG